MAISGSELQVKRLFESLRHVPAGNISKPTSLSTSLEKLLSVNHGVTSFSVDQSIVKLFASAAVEMWHRAVHSYLTSLSLIHASHIWASVAGYYSSHYSVRSLAHIFGVFQLFNAGKIIELELNGHGNLCYVKPKGRDGREHELYWKIVKTKSPFDLDPLFTDNKVRSSQLSDAKHRERANYSDHINKTPNFTPLDLVVLKAQANHIANILIDDPPIPNYEKYAEIENVQIVAYHRIVKVRNYLDEILGSTINYWNVNRNPAWAREIINYEIVESNIGDYIDI